MSFHIYLIELNVLLTYLCTIFSFHRSNIIIYCVNNNKYTEISTFMKTHLKFNFVFKFGKLDIFNIDCLQRIHRSKL